MGKGDQYGFPMPKNLKKDQKFDTPIITPTTKEDYGLHDQPISREEIIKQVLLIKKLMNWRKNMLCNYLKLVKNGLANKV